MLAWLDAVTKWWAHHGILSSAKLWPLAVDCFYPDTLLWSLASYMPISWICRLQACSSVHQSPLLHCIVQPALDSKSCKSPKGRYLWRAPWWPLCYQFLPAADSALAACTCLFYPLYPLLPSARPDQPQCPMILHLALHLFDKSPGQTPRMLTSLQPCWHQPRFRPPPLCWPHPIAPQIRCPHPRPQSCRPRQNHQIRWKHRLTRCLLRCCWGRRAVQPCPAGRSHSYPERWSAPSWSRMRTASHPVSPQLPLLLPAASQHTLSGFHMRQRRERTEGHAYRNMSGSALQCSDYTCKKPLNSWTTTWRQPRESCLSEKEPHLPLTESPKIMLKAIHVTAAAVQHSTAQHALRSPFSSALLAP